MVGGRSFQTQGPETAKLRGPYVIVQLQSYTFSARRVKPSGLHTAAKLVQHLLLAAKRRDDMDSYIGLHITLHKSTTIKLCPTGALPSAPPPV